MDKKLMGCLLSEDEINESWSSYQFSEDMYKDMLIHMRSVLKTQLQSSKLKAYISEQKRDVIKALGQYEMGVISTEECAKRIGITTVEFNDSYYGGE